MATRLLIIHRQLVFAVTIKQALEQTGGFAVHPFVKAEAAFEFLRDHPQDVALVDFNLPGRPGIRIIQQLRAMQPDIVIIVTPRISDGDLKNYNVQGTIDSQFTARELIPILNNALDIAPSEDFKGYEDSAGEMGQLTTRGFTEDSRIRRRQLGTTDHLGDDDFNQHPAPSYPADSEIDEIARHVDESNFGDEAPKSQTKILSDLSPAPPQNTTDRLQTRNLENISEPAQTRPLPQTDESPSYYDEQQEPAQTRNLHDAGINNEEMYPDVHITPENLQTRNLNETSDPPQTRRLEDIPPVSDTPFLRERLQGRTNEPSDLLQTRDLKPPQDYPSPETRPLPGGDTTPLPPPPAPPEFSSLDRVLQSFGFEPPEEEMDTPSVPTKDSDALRQFLATTGSTEDAETFDDVLGSIEPSDLDQPKQQRQVDFEGLVKSMRSDEQPRRLPDRQQQLMDFILTTGMDSIVQEIQKTKTGILPSIEPKPSKLPETPPPVSPPPPSPSFEKLAAEEPPQPTLEENGTVSDLLVGISDSNFRDVLALLNDIPPEAPKPKRPPLPMSETSAPDFSDFAGSGEAFKLGDEDEDEPPANIPTPHVMRAYDYSGFDFDFGEELGEDDEATVAQVVLKTTIDNAALPGDFSLDQLMSDINERLTSHQLKIRPLPSWDMDTTAFHAAVTEYQAAQSTPEPTNIRRGDEPSFLPEMFDEGEIIPPEMPTLDVTEIWTTQASEASLEALEALSADADTTVEPGYFDDSLEDTAQGETAASKINRPTEAEAPPAASWLLPNADMDWEAPPAEWETETPVEQLEQQEEEEAGSVFLGMDEESVLEATAEFMENVSVEPMVDTWDLEPTTTDSQPEAFDIPVSNSQNQEETQLAQLALNLTQVSLEVSAEATILTRESNIIAVAGHLTQDDMIELSNVIQNDWGTGGDGTRLRFITLPTSGKDYMLYTTGTETDLTLSMIFAGTTPLRVIRQQGQKLIKALSSVPEEIIPSALEVAQQAAPATTTSSIYANEQDDSLVYERYAYVWLLRDTEKRLSNMVAQSITAGMMTQLSEQRWKIQTLQVHGDHVYMLADVPGEEPTHNIIRDLKERSSEIAYKADNRLTPQMLWADSYLVVTPGRELMPEEVQEFIEFQRMM